MCEKPSVTSQFTCYDLLSVSSVAVHCKLGKPSRFVILWTLSVSLVIPGPLSVFGLFFCLFVCNWLCSLMFV
jgi:hypothetical protein